MKLTNFFYNFLNKIFFKNIILRDIYFIIIILYVVFSNSFRINMQINS